MKELFTLKRIALWLVLALVLSGCISFTESYISYEDDAHEDGMGYIYGRFATLPMTEGGVPILYNAPVSEYLEDYYFGYPTFSLIIDNNAFYFGLVEDDTVQMMPVRAGTYSIEGIEYLSYEEERDRMPFEIAGYNNEIVVEPNTAVYIGDFSGTLGRNYDNELVWDLHAPSNNYDKTTTELREKYRLLDESNISFSSSMN